MDDATLSLRNAIYCLTMPTDPAAREAAALHLRDLADALDRGEPAPDLPAAIEGGLT